MFKKEEPKVLSSIPTADEYETMKSDQIDENASWFRQHFVGKPYQTFIGSLQTINNSNSLPLIDIITTKDRKRPSTPTNISLNTTNTNTKPIPKRRNSKSLLNSFLSSPSSSSNNNNNNQPPQPQQEKNIGIISVIQERANDFSGPRNGAAAVLGSQYRIIIRSKEVRHRFSSYACIFWFIELFFLARSKKTYHSRIHGKRNTSIVRV